MNLQQARLGYVPYSRDLQQPGDRRRFCYYASKRGLKFEVAQPDRDYDLVYLSSQADISRWSHYTGSAQLVYELVDSYLALPPTAINRLRGLAKFVTRETSRPLLDYRKGITAMAQRADAVVCSTNDQKQDLSAFCDNVHVILDAQPEANVVKEDYSTGTTFNLVWEGLPQNVDAFAAIGGALQEFARLQPCALHLVTDLRFGRYMGRFWMKETRDVLKDVFQPTFLYQWNAFMLPRVVTSCDLAVVPLRLDDPFARGKPENKLLLFWRMGMPAITAASPAYISAMKNAGLEMTCTTNDEWVDMLTRLAKDQDARADAGRAGYAFTKREHSEERLLERWDELFSSLPG